MEDTEEKLPDPLALKETDGSAAPIETKYYSVIGAGAGDEGKGITVLRCAVTDPNRSLVVLTNGGAQRGHSVTIGLGEDQEVFINKHLGSATWCGHSDTYISKTFRVDPIVFNKEYERWLWTAHPVVYVDTAAPFVTPFDVLANQDEALHDCMHNTCGMGIWHSMFRQSRDVCNVSFKAFIDLSPEQKENELNAIADFWLAHGFYDKEISAFFKDKSLRMAMTAHFIEDCIKMGSSVTFADSLPEIEKIYSTVIFESAQGLQIGQQNESQGTQTPSDTGLAGVFATGTAAKKIEVHYVTRTYATRHGDGILSYEGRVSSYIKDDKCNPYNRWQGEFRYGELDVVGLNKRILNDLKRVPSGVEIDPILDVTHCDEVYPEDQLANVILPKVHTWYSPVLGM